VFECARGRRSYTGVEGKGKLPVGSLLQIEGLPKTNQEGNMSGLLPARVSQEAFDEVVKVRRCYLGVEGALIGDS
jgi:hypothetical protein